MCFNYSTDLFIIVASQKDFHIVGICIKYTSAIAFMSSNCCRGPYDATVLTKIGRCAIAITICAAIVVGFVDGIIKCHGNNSTIVQA